jgi:putative Ca2+/H+ antiporter (TMEM165/GDT1 family)
MKSKKKINKKKELKKILLQWLMVCEATNTMFKDEIGNKAQLSTNLILND